MSTSGFLGTRADLLIDAVLMFFIAAPFVMYYVVSLPRRGAHQMHRNLQVGLLLLMALAVLFLELSLRSGSTTEAIALSTFADSALLVGLFAVHLAVAVPTFLTWIALAVLSWRRFRRVLPGDFSDTHRRAGRTTFIGLCLTSATGTALYVMSFAL